MELKYVRGRRGLASARRSNRTFMELKLPDDFSIDIEDQSSNRTFMELKWYHSLSAIYAQTCSNRTFMELKWFTPQGTLLDTLVLIVPLWN